MYQKLIEDLKKRITERSMYAVIIGAVLVLVIYFALDAMEVLPEFRFSKGRVIEQGENVSWIGMTLSPITRDIRKEFNLPRKVNGVFVANEGLGAAKQRGVKTGDVICTVNGRKFKNLRSFIQVADQTRYYDGILLDVYRSGKNVFISIPFLYEYGPLFGPNKGHWQLGAPLIQQLLPYGKAPIMPQFNQAAKEQP